MQMSATDRRSWTRQTSGKICCNEREREREGEKKHGLLFLKASQNTKCFLLRPEAVLSNIFHPVQPQTTERNPFYHNQLAYRIGDDYISASISIQTFSSRRTTRVPERNKIPDVLWGQCFFFCFFSGCPFLQREQTPVSTATLSPIFSPPEQLGMF